MIVCVALCKIRENTRCGDMAIRISWQAYGSPILREGGRRGSAIAPFERTMVVSYKLSIVTVALYVG